ncbi:hypothetical protein BJF85_17025 [Saccharomonospora sp. CUA-673]|uniref:hypothetical protein n=1 Tax=Saccharomonospora sp. CUA-673 TaxID=1904969 RepID=UPI000959AEF5|nr:hypothetical protein [Saccharomonospora sp. CUA-673]OLT46341.1 hypothetical protein BJF85_17025 [Saccharomonospora sp. CUA-673]
MERHSEFFSDIFDESEQYGPLTGRTGDEAPSIPHQADREAWDYHVERKHAETTVLTEAVAAQVRALESVLVDALAQPPFDFSRLRRSFEPVEFAPDPQLTAHTSMPDWDDYRPPSSTLDRLFPDGRRRALRKARARFEADLAEQKRRETDRRRRLRDARAEHDAAEHARAQEVARHNVYVDELEQRVRELDPHAVAEYFTRVAEAHPVPAHVAGAVDISYDPEAGGCSWRGCCRTST